MMASADFKSKLLEYAGLINDDIALLVGGARLGKRKEDKPRMLQLKAELR